LQARLFRRPSLFILDEATSALDIATEAKLLEALRAALPANSLWPDGHRLSTARN